jgi:hypothetical protein
LSGPLEVRQNLRDLGAAEDGGQAARLAGADDLVEPNEFGLEDVAVEKEDRGQRLTLSGNGDAAFLGKMGEEAVEVVAVEVARVAAVELDVAAPSGAGGAGTKARGTFRPVP